MSDGTFVQCLFKRALFNSNLNKQSPLETITFRFVQRMFVQKRIIRRKCLKSLVCSLFKRHSPTGRFVLEQSLLRRGARRDRGFGVYLTDPKKEATT